jgi:hypothetical protein
MADYDSKIEILFRKHNPSRQKFVGHVEHLALHSRVNKLEFMSIMVLWVVTPDAVHIDGRDYTC